MYYGNGENSECHNTFLTGLPINIFSKYTFLYSMVAFRRSSTSSSVKTNAPVLLFLTGFPDCDIFKQRVIR